jgi:phage head maturation protease
MHKDKTASAAFVTRAGAGAIELRSAQEGENITVAGYAAVFNAEADIGGFFYRENRARRV